MTANPRHFLDLDAMDPDLLRAIIGRALAIKATRKGMPKGASDADAPLTGRVLACIFEKQSTRTRVSFDVAMRQLGGQPMMLTGQDMQLGREETLADTARVMSRFVDGIMIRTLRHESLLEMAAAADVPVINALTQKSHPCQIMADIMTYEEWRGPVAGKTFAWLGDGNNVATSLIHAAVKFDFTLRLATPSSLKPSAQVLKWAESQGGHIELVADPEAAVSGVDAVVTDTWVSMGQDRPEERKALLRRYQVNDALMGRAAKDAVFLHCLPAHRGEEVTDSVIDGPQSAVWDEAENRLHVQKAILLWCFGVLNP